MNNNKTPKQRLTWFRENRKIDIKSWRDTLSEHLQHIEMLLDNFGEVADDRSLAALRSRGVRHTGIPVGLMGIKFLVLWLRTRTAAFFRELI